MACLHPLQARLAPLLSPVARLYGWLALAKRRLIRQGALDSWSPPLPCVSIGNISWGGTGKTPLTDWLLHAAEQSGLRAAVLTRGYRSHPPRLPLLVNTATPPEHCGDEPLMLARRHPSALIAVDPDRVRAAQTLLQGQPRPDILFLDDGFQHTRLGRTLDLVLLDPEDVLLRPLPSGNPSSWNRTLPAGTWREPASALTCAHAFLLKTEPETWPALREALALRLRAFPRPVFAFSLRPTGLLLSGTGDPLPAAALNGQPYALLSGVGQPAQVERTARAFLGRPPEQHLAFPDHHDFQTNRASLLRLRLPLVCTAKDAVKLERLALPFPWFALDVTPDFFAAIPHNTPSFPFWWKEELKKKMRGAEGAGPPCGKGEPLPR